MKTNYSKQSSTTTTNLNSKRVINKSKKEQAIVTRATSSRVVAKEPPPPPEIHRHRQSQEAVRMSLVSVDQINRSNPQFVSIYCEKIFQRFLIEEVS